MSRDRRSVEMKAAITVEISCAALERIEELLDADCDAGGIALYNPRRTVGQIRQVLEESKAKLEALQLGEAVPS